MTEPATPAAGTARSRTIDAAILVAGISELVRCTLSELFNPDKVDAAMAKAQKVPAYKAMMTKIKYKPKGAAKGQAPLRNSYTIFVQDFLAHVKAAGYTVTLMEASTLWRVLPAQLKQQLSSRYADVKETFNNKLQAGELVSLDDEMAAHAEAHGMQAVDYVSLYIQYKDVAATTPATAGTGSSKSKAAGADKARIAATSVPAAVSAPAADGSAGKRAGEAGVELHSHKKHKRDKMKKEREGSKEKKHKKHKKEKKHRSPDS